MDCPAVCSRLAWAIALAVASVVPVHKAIAQTIRVDATPARAIVFDPDKAMGSSMDILPAQEFDTVYSEPVIKESLSAGWGPIT